MWCILLSLFKITSSLLTEDKKQEANPQANPSNDDPSAGEKAENAEMEKGTDDNVETNPELSKDENAEAVSWNDIYFNIK